MNAAAVAEILARKRKPVEARPCTERTERCRDARDYRTETRSCCRAHLIRLMRATAVALNELGVAWWADYGTLMGAVRNPLTTWADYHWLPQDGRPAGPLAPGLLPHDKDGDLGLERSAWDTVRVRLPQLLPALTVTVFPLEPSIKVTLSPQNKTNVDLFFWHEEAGTMARQRYAGVDQFKGREFSRDLLYPLTTVEWERLTLPAPRDPEAFLAMRYGPGWRTPLPANHDGVRR